MAAPTNPDPYAGFTPEAVQRDPVGTFRRYAPQWVQGTVQAPGTTFDAEYYPQAVKYLSRMEALTSYLGKQGIEIPEEFDQLYRYLRGYASTVRNVLGSQFWARAEPTYERLQALKPEGASEWSYGDDPAQRTKVWPRSEQAGPKDPPGTYLDEGPDMDRFNPDILDRTFRLIDQHLEQLGPGGGGRMAAALRPLPVLGLGQQQRQQQQPTSNPTQDAIRAYLSTAAPWYYDPLRAFGR